ncbi:hypothetical protein D0502_05985 [Leuconostoc falkenbergense]|uniref:SIR2-like domain-containing protein n=1 Tax=Leuconostoc falkenbergense TaxID=2766470 RepID=A0A9X3E876_9LACO|nr:SIR2 family protein [Leuconostoc falkenbergense]MCX7578929.1 hypothetical protein [Leuconostoc falkenbergense]
MLDRLDTALVAINREARDNSLILFVGAGVSINSGYPSWNSLIEKLREDLPDSSSKKNNQQVAQEYYDTFSRNLYYNKLQEIFEAVKPEYNPILDQIVKIRPKHIITTNYDKLLENSLQNEILQYSVIKSDQDLPYSKDDHIIIKMHGDLDSKNIVLTKSDYENYTKNFENVIVKIRSLLVNHTVLFIGYSLQDETFNNILNLVNDLFSDDAKRAYLYLPEKISSDTIQSYEKKNIFCFTNIGQSDSDNEPGELLTNFLRKIQTHPSFGVDDNIVPQNNKSLWENISFLNKFSFVEGHIVARSAKLVPKAYLLYPDSVNWLGKDIKTLSITNPDNSYGKKISEFITAKTWLNTFLDFERPEKSSNTSASPNSELKQGFDLYLEDKIDSAKSLFRDIANKAYSANDYATYLLAEFNVEHLKLSDWLSTEVAISPQVAGKPLKSVLEEIIQLSSAEEDRLLGTYFRDQIYSFKFVFEKLLKISDLCEKIKAEWYIVKNQGTSYNPNLSILEFEFNSFMNFIYANNLTILHYTEVKSVIGKYFETLLISLSIYSSNRETISHSSSILKSLTSDHIGKIIPYLNYETIKATMESIQLNIIRVEKKALKDIFNDIVHLPKIYLEKNRLNTKLKPYIDFFYLSSFDDIESLFRILQILPTLPINAGYHEKLLSLICKYKHNINSQNIEICKEYVVDYLDICLGNPELAEFHGPLVSYITDIVTQIKEFDPDFVIESDQISILLNNFNMKKSASLHILNQTSDFILGLFYFFSSDIQQLIIQTLTEYEKINVSELNYNLLVDSISHNIYAFTALKSQILIHFSEVLNHDNKGIKYFPDPKRTVTSQAYSLLEMSYITKGDLIKHGCYELMEGYFSDIDWLLFNNHKDETIKNLVKSFSFEKAKEKFAKGNKQKQLFDNWALKNVTQFSSI